MQSTGSKAISLSIQFGSVSLSLIQLPTGVRGLNQTEVSRVIGKDESSFRYFVKSKAVEAQPYKEFKSERIAVCGTNVRQIFIPASMAFSYWMKESKSGNQKARDIVNAIGSNPLPPFEEYGGTYLVFDRDEEKKSVPKRRIQRYSEAWYAARLMQQVGGQAEVITPAGIIDLLTDSEIIEVKQIKSWKAALGQVLVYALYYPSHSKRLHLYGDVSESGLRMIEAHCGKFNVFVTWEN